MIFKRGWDAPVSQPPTYFLKRVTITGSVFIRGGQSQRNARGKEFKAHEAADAKSMVDAVQRRNPLLKPVAVEKL